MNKKILLWNTKRSLFDFFDFLRIRKYLDLSGLFLQVFFLNLFMGSLTGFSLRSFPLPASTALSFTGSFPHCTGSSLFCMKVWMLFRSFLFLKGIQFLLNLYFSILLYLASRKKLPKLTLTNDNRLASKSKRNLYFLSNHWMSNWSLDTPSSIHAFCSTSFSFLQKTEHATIHDEPLRSFPISSYFFRQGSYRICFCCNTVRFCSCCFVGFLNLFHALLPVNHCFPFSTLLIFLHSDVPD